MRKETVLQKKLITDFSRSLSSHSLQKGSLYAATVIARIHDQVDIYGFKKKAVSYLQTHVFVGDNGLLYTGEKNEKIINYHDQLVTCASAMYSLWLYDRKDILLQQLSLSLPFFFEQLAFDTQKTVAAEILIPFYIDMLIKRKLYTLSVSEKVIVGKYRALREKKINSHTSTLLFSIEGFEHSTYLPPMLEQMKLLYKDIDNIEVLAFLSNYFPEAYEELALCLKDKEDYVCNAFTYGEIFDLAWQFHILLYSHMLSQKKLKQLAKISLPSIGLARFDPTTGISISRRFGMKDADTTAMVYKLLLYAGSECSPQVFDHYLQKNQYRDFFSAYHQEIRPSPGTMADILDALSYAPDISHDVLMYIKVCHTYLSKAIVRHEGIIDKWHSSRWYLYANMLIAYTNILLRIHTYIHPRMYVSMKHVQSILVYAMIHALHEDLYPEEYAWIILALRHFIYTKKGMQMLNNTLNISIDDLSETFYTTYMGDVQKLEKMWLVKVSYSPLNVVTMLFNVTTHEI